MGEELLKYFTKPEILKHSGGHFIPASSQHKKSYLEFIDKILNSIEDNEDDS